MKVRLLHPDHDFAPAPGEPADEAALVQDLGLAMLIETMAGGDRDIGEMARQVLLAGRSGDPATIEHRQAVLRDCLARPALVRELHGIAVGAVESKRRQWLGIFRSYPSGILHGSVELLGMLLHWLRELRRLADAHGEEFASPGFCGLMATLRQELPDAYLADLGRHLEELRFPHGLLLRATLGAGNQTTGHTLRLPPRDARPWWRRLLRRPPGLSFRLDPRDEAGARILSEMQDRGLNDVANALAQSADHVLNFFIHLRQELGFYVGALNLHEALQRRGIPVCFPRASPDPGGWNARDLREACLALQRSGVVGNDLDADGRTFVVVTGANQGGKSTFLRALGLAQLMMQSGLFVTAQDYAAVPGSGIFTLFRREEDAAMEHGKLDEELARLGDLAGRLTPRSLLLCNEPFAATNEREGSEIAAQITAALLRARIRTVMVTHLHAFAHRLWEEQHAQVVFLRAERSEDARRTFKLRPEPPLSTSFGPDLYAQVFGMEPPVRTAL
jgi:ABC-type nitrate/sulfonate/bicarbonate transport system ATPase subunit